MKRYLILILLFCTTFIGCSQSVPFAKDLEDSLEVRIKSEAFDKKITDEAEIKKLAAIINDSREVDPPERAKGIKLDVAKETILLKFTTDNFFYIGEGYLFHNGQYYSVSKDIEVYLSK